MVRKASNRRVSQGDRFTYAASITPSRNDPHSEGTGYGGVVRAVVVVRRSKAEDQREHLHVPTAHTDFPTSLGLCGGLRPSNTPQADIQSIIPAHTQKLVKHTRAHTHAHAPHAHAHVRAHTSRWERAMAFTAQCATVVDMQQQSGTGQ